MRGLSVRGLSVMEQTNLKLTPSLYVVVMAGGSGQRFWPASRATYPKQLLAIGGERPMIVEALERPARLVREAEEREGAHQRRFVVAGRAHAPLIHELYPELPQENMIVEPCARNTAPCVALAALHIKQRDPNALMLVCPSDHHIAHQGAFEAAIERAMVGASEGKLVTLGVTPTRPETGYGYLERGAQVDEAERDVEGLSEGKVEPRAEVRRFVEKPSKEVAERYLASGRYLWNSGMFVMSVTRLLSEVERQLPELWSALQALEPALNTPAYEPLLAELFAELRSVSLDYGVMEGAEGVEVVPVDLGWSDVGHWAALRELYPTDEQGNVLVGSPDHVTVRAQDNIVYAERPVALLGVSGLVVAEARGALLVCPAEMSQEVREVVEALKLGGKQGLL